MGSQGRDPGLRLSHGRRLAHHSQVVSTLDERSNPLADNLMIVKEKHTDFH